MLDINTIRKDFPILDQKVNGQKLIYFDNAATSQTPNQVVNQLLIITKNKFKHPSRGIIN